MNNEPVAWINEHGEISIEEHWAYPTPLYTHPVKELTDEEIIGIWDKDCVVLDEDKLIIRFARAILRKAQEKC